MVYLVCTFYVVSLLVLFILSYMGIMGTIHTLFAPFIRDT
jgi:hypothetical protein